MSLDMAGDIPGAMIFYNTIPLKAVSLDVVDPVVPGSRAILNHYFFFRSVGHAGLAVCWKILRTEAPF